MAARVDAMIILGGGIDAQGVLSEVSFARVNHALELYAQRPVPLVLSGRWSLLAQATPLCSESHAMATYLKNQGVDETHLLIEDKSMETIGNAYFSYVRYIRPLNWRHVAIITSEFHSQRAQYAFTKVMGDAGEMRL